MRTSDSVGVNRKNLSHPSPFENGEGTQLAESKRMAKDIRKHVLSILPHVEQILSDQGCGDAPSLKDLQNADERYRHESAVRVGLNAIDFVKSAYRTSQEWERLDPVMQVVHDNYEIAMACDDQEADFLRLTEEIDRKLKAAMREMDSIANRDSLPDD